MHFRARPPPRLYVPVYEEAVEAPATPTKSEQRVRHERAERRTSPVDDDEVVGVSVSDNSPLRGSG